MTIQEIKTESVTKLVKGTGETLDIKDARTVVTSESEVTEANGQVYDKGGSYIGSFNYSRYGGMNISSGNTKYTTSQVGDEVLAFINAVETGVDVSSLSL